MIDWERVAELRSEIGAEGFAEVVELFLDEVEAMVMAMGKTPGKLEDELHFLKGSALNLGFRTFSAQCQKGETLAASGHDRRGRSGCHPAILRGIEGTFHAATR